jgi:heme exporter protein A
LTSLTARNVRVDRGGRTIVNAIGFDLRAGEALVALGRNGAGKSTLLRAIAGFLPLSGGVLTHEGAESETPLPELCHYVGHADGLKSALTAAENLEFWARMLARPTAEETLSPLQALQRVGLKRIADFPVAYLSAGQKRRVALARLFVSPRPLWILDEPATALDVASQDVLSQAFADHRATGGMIIAATHAPLGLVDAAILQLSESDAGARA